MPTNIINVGPQITQLYGAQGSGQSAFTILNTDPANTVYVSDTSNPMVGGSNTLPLLPGASVAFGSTAAAYAVSDGPVIAVALLPQGTQYFQPASLSSLGGVKVYIQAGEPAISPRLPVGSLWLETNAENVVTGWYYYPGGTEWVPQTFNASDVLTAGTIVANLIAAGTIVAGIVNGTTITGAQIVGDGTGIDFLIYNGTPGANNLLISQSVTYATDSYGNQVPAGLTTYSSTQPGSAQNVAWGGITSCLQNASGLASQQGSWNFVADYWQDQSYFYTSVPIAAQEPGGAANTPEMPHSLGALSGTGSANLTVNQGRYMLTADGLHTEIDIVLTATATTTAGTAITFANTLPAAYRPSNSRSYPMGFNGTVTTATDTATLRVGSSGVIELELPSVPSGTIISVTQSVPVY